MIGMDQMNRIAAPAIWQVAIVMAVCVALTGCGGFFAFRDGNSLIAAGEVEQGLGRLEEAARLEPRNAEYRMTLLNQRQQVATRVTLAGDSLRQRGDEAQAEAAYRKALRYDATYAPARQALDSLLNEQRHRAEMSSAAAQLKLEDEQSVIDTLAKVRGVLTENPKQRDALALKVKIDAAVRSNRATEPRLDVAYRKPISLELRDAPLRSVFDVLAGVSGVNFFFDQDIRPDLKTTILARNSSVEEALRLVLVTSQLEQKVLNGNTVLIYPNTPQKQKDYQTLVTRTFYVANAEAKSVAETLKSIVKIRDMSVDERLGLIFVRDTPEAVRMAERIVQLQDIGDPEVMLEVEILEVKRSKLMELGIQWPGQLSLSPLVPNGSSLTLNQLRHLTGNTTQASIGNLAINAYAKDQDSTLLANPRIRVKSKEKAKILIGDRVPVITTTATSTGFVAESVSYLDVGLKLDVEPNVHLDEEVGIKINLEVSNLAKEITSKSGTLAYQVTTRGASTNLRLRNGETQILAGLINDEDHITANKIPAIGDLPVLGRLFGSQKDDGQRSEILLSITPRILRSIRREDLAVAEFESGTEGNIGAPSLRLSNRELAPVAPATPSAAPTVVDVPGEGVVKP